MIPTLPDAETYALVRRFAEAWAAGDLPALIDCYHQDMQFHYFGRNPYAGTHLGKAACIAVMKEMRDKVNRQLVSIQDVLAGGKFGLVTTLERFERHGASVELDRIFRYRVEQGKLAECWVYDQDQRLVDEYLS